MLKLKAVLTAQGKSLTDLAGALGVSRSSVSLLVNQGAWPKSLPRYDLQQRIETFLTECGAPAATVRTAFDSLVSKEAKQPKRPVEDREMLLRKQQFSPTARQAFGLAVNPFDEVHSAQQVYLTPETRYVREALRHTALHGGFMAVVGESGAGKSTLRRDLLNWIADQGHAVVVVEPYVLGMEDNDMKGKTLRASHIAEAILTAVAPATHPKRSPEARSRQVHNALRESHRAGNRHLLIIEEAHGLSVPTLKHLKRFLELEDGFQKLLGVVLIGQTELAQKLDERNPSVREVVQRCELITLRPLDNELEGYLRHRFSLAGKDLAEVMDATAIEALRTKLTGGGHYSVLYPLAIHNVLTAALNEAAALGIPRLTDEVIAAV